MSLERWGGKNNPLRSMPGLAAGPVPLYCPAIPSQLRISMMFEVPDRAP